MPALIELLYGNEACIFAMAWIYDYEMSLLLWGEVRRQQNLFYVIGRYFTVTWGTLLRSNKPNASKFVCPRYRPTQDYLLYHK